MDKTDPNRFSPKLSNLNREFGLVRMFHEVIQPIQTNAVDHELINGMVSCFELGLVTK